MVYTGRNGTFKAFKLPDGNYTVKKYNPHTLKFESYPGDPLASLKTANKYAALHARE